LVKKWLKAGVMEEGRVIEAEDGTPQGAVISPLLANVYLHYVLDLWVQAWRRHARGLVSIVRYADDFVAGFQVREDARSLYAALFERFAQFGLEIHPEKTRLIRFGRYARANAQRDGKRKPETFDFLGFTHVCSYAHRNAGFKLLRISRKDRYRNKLRAIKEWLRKHRHFPVPEQGRYLRQVVQGWFGYHAVPGNFEAVRNFRYHVSRLWFRSLRRRSHKARRLTWDRMNRHIERWLPPARILHPYPSQRFASRT
jgi:hypothetical protein